MTSQSTYNFVTPPEGQRNLGRGMCIDGRSSLCSPSTASVVVAAAAANTVATDTIFTTTKTPNVGKGNMRTIRAASPDVMPMATGMTTTAAATATKTKKTITTATTTTTSTTQQRPQQRCAQPLTLSWTSRTTSMPSPTLTPFSSSSTLATLATTKSMTSISSSPRCAAAATATAMAASTPASGASVTFNESCTVVLIPSHREYSDEEHRDCWYDDEDSEDAVVNNIETVRVIRRRRVNMRVGAGGKDSSSTTNGGVSRDICGSDNLNLDDDDDDDDNDPLLCGRGLESLIDPSGPERVRFARSSVLDAVLWEQRRQRHEQRKRQEQRRRRRRRVQEGSAEHVWRDCRDGGSDRGDSADFDDIDNDVDDDHVIDEKAERIRRASIRASAPSVERAIRYAICDARYVRSRVASGCRRSWRGHMHQMMLLQQQQQKQQLQERKLHIQEKLGDAQRGQQRGTRPNNEMTSTSSLSSSSSSSSPAAASLFCKKAAPPVFLFGDGRNVSDDPSKGKRDAHKGGKSQENKDAAAADVADAEVAPPVKKAEGVGVSINVGNDGKRVVGSGGGGGGGDVGIVTRPSLRDTLTRLARCRIEIASMATEASP